MKAPQVETLDDAFELAECIHWATGRRKEYSFEFVEKAFAAGTLQAVIDNDWEHIWNDKECQKIMAHWIAYRISR